jgi:integrase
MGSRVRPDFDLLRAVAETLRNRLSAPLLPGARLDEIAAAHDAFACHALLVLMLATGHRPVGAPFERLGDFDLVSGLVWISDKRTRKGRASRIALLPPAGLAQLHAWLRHLKALDRRLTPFRPDSVRERLRPALRIDDAEAPALFFFLDALGGVVDASVEAMGDRMEDILPVQLNWPRHVLRSRLASGGASAQAVDALLGHGSATEAPFGRHSALTIDDLRPLSDRAAALLADLGFAALESPL